MTNAATYNTETFRQAVRIHVLEWLSIPGMSNRRHIEPCGLWFTRDIRSCLCGYGGAELLPLLAGYEVRWTQADRRLKAAASKAIIAELYAMVEEGLMQTERPDRFRRWFVTEGGRAWDEARKQSERDELERLLKASRRSRRA